GLYGNPVTLYTEGFETWPPAGWIFEDESGAGGWIPSTNLTQPTPRTGIRAMANLWNATIPANTWAYMPGMEMVAGETYDLSFWYRTGSIGGVYPEPMKITAGNAPNI